MPNLPASSYPVYIPPRQALRFTPRLPVKMERGRTEAKREQTYLPDAATRFDTTAAGLPLHWPDEIPQADALRFPVRLAHGREGGMDDVADRTCLTFSASHPK